MIDVRILVLRIEARGFACVLQGGAEIPKIVVRDRTVEIELSVHIRIQPEKLRGICSGVLPGPTGRGDNGKLLVGTGEFRVRLKRLAISTAGVIEFVVLLKQASQFEPGDRVSWVVPNGAAELPFSLCPFLFLQALETFLIGVRRCLRGHSGRGTGGVALS